MFSAIYWDDCCCLNMIYSSSLKYTKTKKKKKIKVKASTPKNKQHPYPDPDSNHTDNYKDPICNARLVANSIPVITLYSSESQLCSVGSKLSQKPAFFFTRWTSSILQMTNAK